MKELELEQLRHLCRIDLIQQAGYWIEIKELVPLYEPSRYSLVAKKGGVQFDFGRPLLSSELDDGVKELYNTMTQQGVLNKYNDQYMELVEELWEKISKVGRPRLSHTKVGTFFKWRLELAGAELLGTTIIEALDKAMPHLDLPLKELLTSVEQEQEQENEVINIRWDEGSSLYIDEEKLGEEGIELVLDVRESLNIVEKDGKMILHLNGAPIPNLESCWITPRENGALEVEITYAIEPKG